jgi:hypothetical protein
LWKPPTRHSARPRAFWTRPPVKSVGDIGQWQIAIARGTGRFSFRLRSVCRPFHYQGRRGKWSLGRRILSSIIDNCERRRLTFRTLTEQVDSVYLDLRDAFRRGRHRVWCFKRISNRHQIGRTLAVRGAERHGNRPGRIIVPLSLCSECFSLLLFQSDTELTRMECRALCDVLGLKAITIPH